MSGSTVSWSVRISIASMHGRSDAINSLEIINILRGFPENELNRQLEDLYLMGYELQRNAFFTKNDTTNHTEEE